MVFGVSKERCWCFSLRKAAFFVAGTTLAFGIAGVLYGGYELLSGATTLGLLTMGVEGGGILLALMLFYAVRKDKRVLARVWEVGAAVVVLMLAAVGIYTAIKKSIGVGLGMVGAALLQIYFLAIVHAYAASIQAMITVDQ
ncbi:uncharacterized protein LOC127004925 isoform X1 [Eriocheir sinensis]|uniref:uncharacterized protein LOC127004925 isoform X1 n=1 Tax=Eriocheir sinensis TaxID=95602 RepID=UPI0021CA276E|nr:uncharacterized protein LOC127004925 isoform X1 [Eriocheir sinensis]